MDNELIAKLRDFIERAESKNMHASLSKDISLADAKLIVAALSRASLPVGGMPLKRFSAYANGGFYDDPEGALVLYEDAAGLAADGERYRYLRERFNGDTWLEHSLADMVPYEVGPDAMISGNALDAAIDAALSAKGDR